MSDIEEIILQEIKNLELSEGKEVVIVGNKQALRQMPLDSFMGSLNNVYPIIWNDYKCFVLHDTPSVEEFDNYIYLIPIPYEPLRVKVVNESDDLR